MSSIPLHGSLRKRARLGVPAIVALAFVVLWAAVARSDDTGHEPGLDIGAGQGRWHPTPGAVKAPSDEAIENLLAIGYLRGSRPATRSGVTIHDPDRAWKGLNLYSSGHAPEARLIDMDGRTLHRWGFPFKQAYPDSKNDSPNTRWWRRVALLPNGDLIAIFEGAGLIKIDKDSNLIWASPLLAHHDLYIMKSGTIFVLTREAHILPRISKEQPTLEDFVSVLDSNGRLIRKSSLLEAFENSEFAPMIRQGKRQTGDIFHTNTLVVLDAKGSVRQPLLKPGRLLVSMNALGVVAIVDPKRETLVWVRKTPPLGQHDASIIMNGNMLLFNNNEGSGRSEVIELEPSDGKTVWSYRGSDDQPFYSEFLGGAQRLWNGNTLITESDGGRAFEVTRKGEIVWEFHNPHHTGGAGEGDEKVEFVATLPEMQRLPPGTPIEWAAKPESDADLERDDAPKATQP